jgi:hypothetical protein
MFLCQLGGIQQGLTRTNHKRKEKEGGEKHPKPMQNEYARGESRWVRRASQETSHMAVQTSLPSYTSSHSLHSLAFFC